MRPLVYGVLGAMLAAVGWIAVRLVGPIVWARLMATWHNTGGGVGVGYLDTNSVLVAAVVGFVAGYWFGR